MKRLLIPISIIAASFYFGSCNDLKIGDDFLEKAPGADVTLDTIFASKQYAERALAAAYRHLPYGVMYSWDPAEDKLGVDLLESTTDLCQSYLGWGCGAERHYYNGQYNASVADTYDVMYAYTKERSWEAIRKAYIFLENVDRVPDMTAEEKAIRKGEAKMVIAVQYTQMMRHFGGLPLIDKAIYPGDDYNYPRETIEKTVNFIVNLCNEAASVLPWQVSVEEDGRFTKAAALGLKVRVLLFAASPLFNDNQPYLDGEASTNLMVWYGNKSDQRWQDVVDACKEFEQANNSGSYNYQLVETGDYRQDFQDAWYKRRNGEVLISTRVAYTCPDIWDGNFYFMQSAGWYGCSCPTLNYMDMFGNADGSSFNIDWDNIPQGVNPFEDRDPRLYETLVINGDKWQGRTAETYIGGQEQKTENDTRCRTGSVMRKFLREHDYATLTGSVIHWPYLRLAEIYLSYAEALNELGRTGEAYEWVDKVRGRVGLPKLQRNLSQEQFREMVLNERAVEFGFEEIRWFDLVRWKRTEDFTKPLYGVKIWSQADGSYKYEKWQLAERYWKKNWSPKWYLCAFPPEEINKGYGLVQNPGC